MGGSSEKLANRRKRPRRCVGCGREEPKKGLMRVVRSPDGIVSLDVTGRAPGRGAYLCADAECVKKAMKKNALARALKQPVDPDIYHLAEEAAIERGKQASARG
ncbi:MAG: YlxR family protein [Synergistaceae bacterium]|jgi:predicted RNA-binding protein YlxR (DUF448 family)|nr:YlxR family protein [Synergistaceae bacterium]